MIAPRIQSDAAKTSAPMRAMIALAAVGCLAIPASAQGRGQGVPPASGVGNFGGGVSVGMGGGANRNSIPNENRASAPYSPESQGHLQLTPPGRWWDDKQLARSIGLDSKQQKRMDDVFGGNRDNLMKLYKSLQHEQSQLEKLSRSRELDENQIFQQIDRVTQVRGELEKANAHMLLQMRRELTPEQTSRLNDFLAQPTQ